LDWTFAARTYHRRWMHLLMIDMLGNRTMRRGMPTLAPGLLPLAAFAPLCPRRPPLPSLAKPALPLLELPTQLLQFLSQGRVLALKLLDSCLGRHAPSMTGVGTYG